MAMWQAAVAVDAMCVRRGLSGGISAGESFSQCCINATDARAQGLGLREGLEIMLLAPGGFMLPLYDLTGLGNSTDVALES